MVVASFIWLILTLILTLTQVNQIYTKYFKERGMCYKKDKILQKNFEKNNFWKKYLKK